MQTSNFRSILTRFENFAFLQISFIPRSIPILIWNTFWSLEIVFQSKPVVLIGEGVFVTFAGVFATSEELASLLDNSSTSLIFTQSSKPQTIVRGMSGLRAHHSESVLFSLIKMSHKNSSKYKF